MNTVEAAIHGMLKFAADVAPVVFAIGVLGLVRIAILWQKGSQARRWPVANGVITEVSVERTRTPLASISRGPAPKVTFYKPRIRFAYEVRETRFVGSRVQFGMAPRHRVKELAEAAISQYTNGQIITVRYDPEKPEESVLTAGVDSFWKKRLLFALAFVAAGGSCWFLLRSLP